MDIRIEYLQREDLPQYKVLMDECFGSSKALTHYQNRFDENRSDYRILAAKAGGKLVGSVTFYKIDLFTFSFQPALELFNVGVLKAYRGNKIGQKLIEFVFDYAKQNGYNSVSLTCLDTAKDAHKLYEKMGFEKMSSLKYNKTINEK